VRIWLAGVGDREAAERLRGCDLAVARADLPPLREGEFYLADAVGLSVLQDERELGRVVAVTSNGAQALLEVESGSPRRRWLFPAVPELLRGIDERGVHVELPPGLGPPEPARGKAP
jgi:16S rRNA processing protein RimM